MRIHLKKVDLAMLIFFAAAMVSLVVLSAEEKPELDDLGMSLGLVFIVFLVMEFYRRSEHLSREVLNNLQGKATEKAQRDNYYQTEAMFWLAQQLQPKYPLPPLREWVLSPDAVNSIITLIKQHQPKHMVELGGGVSTLVFSHVIGSGHITAFDHDGHYAEVNKQNLKLHGLEDKATVYHAPLSPISIDGNNLDWYKTDDIDKLEGIDMLLIDGPPGQNFKNARYPAMPHLYSKLNKGAIIILDDAARPDEQEIIKLWMNKYPDLTLNYQYTEKGLAIFTKG